MFDSIRDRTLVLFGELHGTAEAPALVAAALEAAAARGGPVALGIEWPDALQVAIDSFLTTGDHGALVATPAGFWGWRDGRSSAAMIALLEHARTLHARVICFDGEFGTAEQRDAGMAARLLAAIDADPIAVVLALCGNLHARTNAPWMGWHLRARHPRLVSLDIRHAGGTAWCCTPEGEPGVESPFLAMAGQLERGIRLYERPDDHGYDGEYAVGTITASPPIV